MQIKVPNLFRHADGGYYCLISDDTPLKFGAPGPDEWHDGVVYAATDGRMRSTTLTRWLERFEPVAELNTDDPEIISMVQRCNPGSGFDFADVFSAWHESEMGITGQMLELTVAAVVEAFTWSDRPAGGKAILPRKDDPRKVAGVRLRITTEDLQRVSQNYEIKRVPDADGYTFIVEKSFPNEG